MFLLPEDYVPLATIIGIDPGTDTLGIASITFDVRDARITETRAVTYHGSKLIKGGWMEDVHGARFARIQALRETLGHWLRLKNPQYMTSESPFFNRMRPQAYGALTEIVYALKMEVFDHAPDLELVMVDPPRVKNAVGAKGNAGKDEVKAGVLAIPHLNYVGLPALADLDEHSIDAIAVAKWRYETILARWYTCSELA